LDRKETEVLAAIFCSSQSPFAVMFLFMYGISDSRLRRLREHNKNSGLSSRTYGNTRRLPKNTLPFAVVEDVKLFLANYAEEHAISLPGRIPGYKDEDIKLLFSHETKRSMCGALMKLHAKPRESRLLAS